MKAQNGHRGLQSPAVPPTGQNTNQGLVRLDQDSIEAVARRVVELLRDEDADRLLSAVEVSERYGVTRRWVYEHRDELGAVALGDGERPRLGFPASEVARRLVARQMSERSNATPKPPKPAGRAGRTASGRSRRRAKVPLLQVGVPDER